MPDEFLGQVIFALDGLRKQAEKRGHPMLAYLLQLSRQEAEDEMNAAPSGAAASPDSQETAKLLTLLHRIQDRTTRLR
jgi:hypothetical protein